ncbi:MAG: phosphomannomutase/phosphoglucomutase [Treponema sp.]|nr:phosphomannomutase/phosphoglucomutase [Treponema sp.]
MAVDYQKLQNGSDVRGVAVFGVNGEPVTFPPSACRSIAQAFVFWLSEKCGTSAAELVIGVGRDSRISGEALSAAAVDGITAGGAQAVDCGMATTPALFMATVFPETQFDGAIMLTASHLPYNRNGMKFFDRNGGLEHSDISALLTAAARVAPQPEDDGALPAAERLQDGSVSPSSDHRCTAYALLPRYAAHLRHAICTGLGVSESDRPLSGIHFVVDAGNGAGGFFATDVLAPLGANISGSVFLEPDGRFPHHIPNPENAAAMAALRNAVVRSRADFGFIFDTDVDRMAAVCADGTEINRDAVIALTAAILAPRYPGSTIVTDSVTSDRLTYFLEQCLQVKHLRYKRGYKNVINKCKELNAHGTVSPLAMETSGHGALKDNWYLDDGAFLAVEFVIALTAARRSGQTIEQLLADFPPALPGEEHEYRLKITADDFLPYGNAVLAAFERRARENGYTVAESYEGVRLSFDEADVRGWMLLRLSLHDPVMPLNVEGLRAGSCAEILARVKALLTGFDCLDTGELP